MMKSIIKANIRRDVKICNEKIHRAVVDLIAELYAEHERNKLDMSLVDDYK